MVQRNEPLHEPLYDIRLLGQLAVRRDGELLNTVHKKGIKSHKALASLILARGKTVPNYKLIKITKIDPGENAEGSLKVLIHRIRRLMFGELEFTDTESCINKTMGGYAWNMNCARVDLFEAESVCERVMSAGRLSMIDPEDISALLESYARKLLPEMGEEAWVELARFNFEKQCTEAISHLLMLMWNAGAVDKIIQTCLRGLENDPMESIFWEHLKSAMEIAKQHPDT